MKAFKVREGGELVGEFDSATEADQEAMRHALANPGARVVIVMVRRGQAIGEAIGECMATAGTPATVLLRSWGVDR